MRVAPEAACATKSTRVSNQGHTASAGIPCTMVLTVSFVLSPVTGLFCHRHFAGHVPRTLAPASGRQDHTTSPSVAASFVRVLFPRLTLPRPSHPAPNVRDDRERPSCGCGTGERKPLIWVRRKAEYFCNRDWTTQIALNHLTKSRFRRRPFSAVQVVRAAQRPQNRPELPVGPKGRRAITSSATIAHKRGREPQIQSGRRTSALVRIPGSRRTRRHFRNVSFATVRRIFTFGSFVPEAAVPGPLARGRRNLSTPTLGSPAQHLS